MRYVVKVVHPGPKLLTGYRVPSLYPSFIAVVVRVVEYSSELVLTCAETTQEESIAETANADKKVTYFARTVVAKSPNFAEIPHIGNA